MLGWFFKNKKNNNNNKVCMNIDGFYHFKFS